MLELILVLVITGFVVQDDHGVDTQAMELEPCFYGINDECHCKRSPKVVIFAPGTTAAEAAEACRP